MKSSCIKKILLLIRFGTDYLWRYIGLIHLVDGEADKCP